MNLKDHFPRASESFLALNSKDHAQVNLSAAMAHYEANHQRKIQDSEPQHHQTPALGRPDEGKKEGVGVTRISFTLFRVRPLDPDNAAGSCKDLLDGCVHAGLLFDDAPWLIIFETKQEKVKSYAEERTVIEIEPEIDPNRVTLCD